MGDPFQGAEQRLGTNERSLRAVRLDHYDPLADALLSAAPIDNPLQKTNAVRWHLWLLLDEYEIAPAGHLAQAAHGGWAVGGLVRG